MIWVLVLLAVLIVSIALIILVFLPHLFFIIAHSNFIKARP